MFKLIEQLATPGTKHYIRTEETHKTYRWFNPLEYNNVLITEGLNEIKTLEESEVRVWINPKELEILIRFSTSGWCYKHFSTQADYKKELVKLKRIRFIP
jgi:hypothetical protein